MGINSASRDGRRTLSALRKAALLGRRGCCGWCRRNRWLRHPRLDCSDEPLGVLTKERVGNLGAVDTRAAKELVLTAVLPVHHDLLVFVPDVANVRDGERGVCADRAGDLFLDHLSNAATESAGVLLRGTLQIAFHLRDRF